MGVHLFAVLLWCAGALPGLLAVQLLSTVTCDNDSLAAAAALGVQHINGRQKHGFRFKLQEVLSSKYQKVSGGCHIDVTVKLVQTKCHFTNPKSDDQCELWRRDERGVVAMCSIEFWVMWGLAEVIRHECTTRPEFTNEEMVTICPSCPELLALDDLTAVEVVNDAVVKFNRERKHLNYFTLMEVAQVTKGYAAKIGTMTWLKFVLVETTCPRGARNTFVACAPRCSDIAHHAFCQTTYYNLHRELGQLECELYPPKNTAPYPTGVPEPVCKPLFHQSPEACVCKDRLSKPDPSVHHICPFPLK
ncbi:antihemorrhagic factor BJ46a-like [Hippocampus comes]|uniref:antihemorrhagic factor BJ46a-like n=1 Tax=Hippocampus comes TaxID=109280 RepID=UPI00094E7577|nr:PREDICTED: antihemorrhagic factor BJ46a-like [Hippocampus comes]